METHSSIYCRSAIVCAFRGIFPTNKRSQAYYTTAVHIYAPTHALKVLTILTIGSTTQRVSQTPTKHKFSIANKTIPRQIGHSLVPFSNLFPQSMHVTRCPHSRNTQFTVASQHIYLESYDVDLVKTHWLSRQSTTNNDRKSGLP